MLLDVLKYYHLLMLFEVLIKHWVMFLSLIFLVKCFNKQMTIG